MKIKPKLLGESPASLVKPLTTSQEAYGLYLKAGDRLWGWSLADNRAAIQMLETATALDPRFTQAWAPSDTPSLSHTHHVWHFAAAASAVLGDHADAVEALRRAAATGMPNYPLFRDDPHFTGLRETTAMKTLLAELERAWDGYRREFGRA